MKSTVFLFALSMMSISGYAQESTVEIAEQDKPKLVYVWKHKLDINMTCESKDELVYDRDGFHPIDRVQSLSCRWSEVERAIKNKYSTHVLEINPVNDLAKQLKEKSVLEGSAELKLNVNILLKGI